MSMSTGGNSGGSMSEMNVTPLIDVLLVLLIIFMIIVPVTPKGLPTLIPQPPKNPNQTPPDNTTIVVQVLSSPSGIPTYKINDDTFEKSQIEPKLAAIFATRSTKTMFVKGDAALDFNTVAAVINMGHEANVDNIGLITPKVEAGQ